MSKKMNRARKKTKKTLFDKTWKIIKENKFTVTGIFFLILQLMLIYKYTHILAFSNMLWFCSHTPILFAIGFFMKNMNIIKSLICVGLIPQIIWIIDFVGKILFGTFIFGVTDYMFLNMTIFTFSVSVIEHFLSAPLALLLTYKYKTEKKVLVYALIYLIIILFLSITLNAEDYNYNLVRNIRIFDEFTFKGYTIAWPLLAMILVVIPTYYMQKYVYKKTKHYKKKKEKKRRKEKNTA
jgi:hypothetical protein